MYRTLADATMTDGGLPTVGGDYVVGLDQVPRWGDAENRSSLEYDNQDPTFPNLYFPDPLAPASVVGSGGIGLVSPFPVDHEINSRIYLWRGNPWYLEVDAVVNSTNEGGCRSGMAKVTNAYDLPARRVFHTVGPKYSVKYHTAAENALSHCYRSCLELLVENGLQSIAMGCIYTEAKNYPREQAAHVAIRTVRRFLEKQRDKKIAVIFCTTTSFDTEIYKRNSSYLESYLDPLFMSLIKDPDQRRKEQWEKTARAQNGWNCAKILGFGDLGGPPLSAADEYSLHSRYLSKAKSLNLSEIAEMKIVYRGGVDSEGRPLMVVVGAHFLIRCLHLEQFVLYVLKEFEPLIQKPCSIVYFHSAASLQLQPDLGWMRRLQQIIGRRHQRNLQAIYVLHPTFGLRAAIFALQMLVDNLVWKKVVYVDRLLQLFRYVHREQMSIPEFVFQLSSFLLVQVK